MKMSNKTTAGLYTMLMKLFSKTGKTIATVIANVQIIETKIISMEKGETLNTK